MVVSPPTPEPAPVPAPPSSPASCALPLALAAPRLRLAPAVAALRSSTSPGPPPPLRPEPAGPPRRVGEPGANRRLKMLLPVANPPAIAMVGVALLASRPPLAVPPPAPSMDAATQAPV